MLQAAITACAARPEQTVMIGDTGHDMRMARAADVWAQGVSWGFHTEAEQVEAGAHHVAATFDDLTCQLETFAARQRETT
jgi:phosphoglycolate phosphatase